MSELSVWLLARIAEDEARASSHHRLLCMRTACDNEGCIWGADEEDAMARERVCTCGYPARVLAEYEAKRRIVEVHTGPEFGRANAHLCRDCMTPDDECETLRLLALPYAGCDGYQEAWTP